MKQTTQLSKGESKTGFHAQVKGEGKDRVRESPPRESKSANKKKEVKEEIK